MTAEQLAKLNKLAERWANEPPESDNEYDIATDVMDLLPDVLDHIKQLTAERDAALKACAEMRDALLFTKHCKPIFPWLNHETKIKHALSTDCGKGYVKAESLTCFKCGDGNTPLYCLNCAREGYHHDDEWRPVVEALKWCVDHCGGYDRQQAKEALAHAAKLMEGK